MKSREELKKLYKETPQPMGVFLVRNIRNGRCLVSSSRNLPGILNRARFMLEGGLSRNRQLQSDWKESGAPGFELRVLDELKPKDEPGWDPAEDLAQLEKMWQEKLTGEGAELYENLL